MDTWTRFGLFASLMTAGGGTRRRPELRDLGHTSHPPGYPGAAIRRRRAFSIDREGRRSISRRRQLLCLPRQQRGGSGRAEPD